MSDFEHVSESMEVRWGAIRYTYHLTNDSLVLEWRRGIDFSKTSWPLRGMSPALKEMSGRSSETASTVRISFLLVAASIIVFFSEFNGAIPLLAPFLLLLGIWWLINALRTVTPRNWTVVRASGGADAFSLVQPEEKSEAWTTFENRLSEAIRRANSNET